MAPLILCLLVGTQLPLSMRKEKAPRSGDRVKVSVRRIEQIQPTSTTSPPPKNAVAGKHPIAVVLIETDDAQFSSSDPKGDVEKAFFGEGKGSLADYYKEQSYGLYQLHGRVLGPIRVKGRLSSYGYGPGQSSEKVQVLIKQAFDAVAADVDLATFDGYNVFSQPQPDGAVDHFAVIFPSVMQGSEGYFKPIWPHRGSIDYTSKGKKLKSYYVFSFPMPMGTLAHEHGHDIGLPDLYDRDDTSHGAGPWCLMASGNWQGRGDLPAHISAWGKVQMGWVRPQIISQSQERVQIPAVETSPTVLKVPIGAFDSSEYFLVENRQRIGYDAQLPDEGLFIWHIDTAIKNNDDENHKLVDLVEPAAVQDLDRLFRDRNPDLVDAFAAGKRARLDDQTDPSSRRYDGKPSGISISDISASKGVMSASFTVPTLRVPDGEPFTLVRDNYAYGPFGAVPLGAGAEELMPFQATEGGFDVQTVEVLAMARPNTVGRETVTLYSDSGGAPGAVIASTTGSLATKADSYAWMKARFDKPPRIASKTKFWIGVTHDRDQVALAYNPESVSKESRFRQKGEKTLRNVYNFAKGKETSPDFIMRAHGYGFIGVNAPKLPPQADEADALVKQMRDADKLLDQKKFLEASAIYSTILPRMSQDQKRFATWIPVVINAQGVADYQAKNWKGALDAFQRSLKHAQQLGDPRAESDILENIGETHYFAGDLKSAEEYCMRALAMNRERPDRLLESEYWLGRIKIAARQPDAAAQHFDAAKLLAKAVHKDALETQQKWIARIDRGRGGNAQGEDGIDGESRVASELQAEHKAEQAGDTPVQKDDSMSGNQIDLKDFGF